MCRLTVFWLAALLCRVTSPLVSRPLCLDVPQASFADRALLGLNFHMAVYCQYSVLLCLFLTETAKMQCSFYFGIAYNKQSCCWKKKLVRLNTDIDIQSQCGNCL